MGCSQGCANTSNCSEPSRSGSPRGLVAMSTESASMLERSTSAAPSAFTEDPDVLEKLEAVLDRFEITIAQANELVVLQDYEMVVIADDSGSMNNAAQPSHVRKPGEPKRTRWHELVDTVSEMVEIASCFDTSGIDIYFLNRPPAFAVPNCNDELFIKAFEKRPTGTTPLTETLRQVAEKHLGERKVLLFILTDGEPDGGKEKFMQAIGELIGTGQVHIQIMACTAEEEEIGWLNTLDTKLKQVDVTDDYYAEKAEVIGAGLRKKFTRGDWCMKAMVAPVCHKFDAWDEALGKNQGGCCESCTIM